MTLGVGLNVSSSLSFIASISLSATGREFECDLSVNLSVSWSELEFESDYEFECEFVCELGCESE